MQAKPWETNKDLPVRFRQPMTGAKAAGGPAAQYPPLTSLTLQL